MRILVLGASGGCGRWLCELGASRGYQIRALVRPATSFTPSMGVEVVRGEVLDDGVLEQVVEGCEGVLSALGIQRRSLNPWSSLMSPPDLTTQVAQRLVEVLPKQGIGRVLAISAAGVGASIAQVHPLIRWMIENSNLAASYVDLAGMEAVFAESNLDWMTVRPTTLTEGKRVDTVHTVAYYGLFSRVPRKGVAHWMLEALTWDKDWVDRTPMIAA